MRNIIALGAAAFCGMAFGAGPIPVIEFTLGDGMPGSGRQRTYATSSMTCRVTGDTVIWTDGAFGGDAFRATAERVHLGPSESWAVSWSGFASTSFVESVAISFVVPRVGAASVLAPHVPGWLLRPDWSQVKPNASLQGGRMHGCKVQCVFNVDAPSWTCELRGARFEPVTFALRVGPTAEAVRMRYAYEMPVSRAASTAFRLPFATVLTPFEGGWFQAAEIYRRGVWTTDWYRKCRARDFGKLRDVGMWFWNRRTSDIVIPPVEKFQADAGVPVALDWYWWHKTSYDTGYPNFWPPRENEADFRAAVRRLNAKGIYCQTYVNGMTWDVDDPSWTEGGSEGVKILRDGTFRAYPWNRFTGHRLGYMCGEAPKYQARLRAQVRTLRDCGFDGQYLDMIGNAGYGACWNTNHTHALGGGDHMVRNFRAYVETVRRENSGLQLSTEDINEAYMDLFESVIALGPSYERTSGISGGIPRECVPFAQAVYHGAITMFGTFSMLDGIPAFDPLWPAEEQWKDEKPWERLFPDQFQVELSRCVIWGQQPCVHNFRLNNATDPRYREGYRFMIDTARFYHANRDWLFDGGMCDPGRLDCMTQKVEFLQRATYTKAGEYKVATHVLPTVFHSVWKAPDGRIAAFLVNWSRQSQRYALTTPQLKAEGVLQARSWKRID